MLYILVLHTTILRPFFRDHPGEPVPEENFWTLWCKGRLTDQPSGLAPLHLDWPVPMASAHLHRPPFFTGRMPFLPRNQQCQNTEGNRSMYWYSYYKYVYRKTNKRPINLFAYLNVGMQLHLECVFCLLQNTHAGYAGSYARSSL